MTASGGLNIGSGNGTPQGILNPAECRSYFRPVRNIAHAVQNMLHRDSLRTGTEENPAQASGRCEPAGTTISGYVEAIGYRLYPAAFEFIEPSEF